MKENTINEFARTFLSVIAGAMAAIATGALMLPLVKMILDKFFNFYILSAPSPYVWKDGMMPGLILFGWLFFSSLIGGLVCTILSTNKDMLHVLISSLVTIVVVFIVSKEEVMKEKNLLPSLLILLAIPVGNLIGGWVGGSYKRKKSAHTS